METASPIGLAAFPSLDLSHTPSLNLPADSPSPSPPPSAAWDGTVHFSPTKRSKGKRRVDKHDAAPLEAKDHNKEEGNLVDIDSSDSGFSDTLAPTSGSHFALSLLDKSPSFLKAHLKTPLVPLGSPITARKTRRTASAQENSPCVRTGVEKRSFSSPSVANNDARDCPLRPSSPNTSPSKPSRVRFSPATAASPRTRSSARKPRIPSTPSLHTPKSATRPPQNQRLASLATPLQRFAAHPLASPFAFSPYTPPVRTAASYRDEDLTDCDADGSLYDDEYEEEQLLSYAPAEVEADDDEAVDELFEALAPLSVSLAEREPEEEDSPEADEQPHERSIELTETELEESSASEQEDEEDVDELADSSAASEASESEVDELESEEEVEGPAQQLSLASAAAEEETIANSPPAAEGGPVEAVVDSDEAVSSEPIGGLDAPEASVEAPFEQMESGEVLEEPLRETPLRETLEDEEAVVKGKLDLEDAPTAISEVQGPINVEIAASEEEEQVAGAAAAPSSSLLSPIAVPAASTPLRNTSSPPLPSSASTEEVGDSLVVDSTPPSTPLQPRLVACTLSLFSPFPNSTPLPPSVAVAFPIVDVSTPAPQALTLTPAKIAATPGKRPTTPSARTRTPSAAVKQAVPPLTTAPTAQRQLSKLTSLSASQRTVGGGSIPPPSAGPSRSTLTSLIPGSTATGSRRLLAPTARSALPKPASGVPTSVARKPPSTLSAVRELPAAVSEVAEEESKRTVPSLASSVGSSTSQGTLPRPRAALHSSLRRPATVTSSTAAPRTLGASDRSAPPAPALTKPVAPRRTRTAPSASTAAPATGLTSATMISRLARTASATEPSSSLRPALSSSTSRVPSALLQTSSAPTLGSTRAPCPSLLLPSRPARTPRAALSAVAKPPAPFASLPLPLPTSTTSSSPNKRRPARLVGGRVEVSKSALPDLEPLSPVEPDTAPLSSLPPPEPTLPAPAFLHSSPPRTQSTRPPASPIRSPRRVLVSTQAPATTASPVALSALSAPAEKLAVSTSSDIFGVASAKPAPAPLRATRTRRTQPLEANSAPLVPVVRTTRRTGPSSIAAPTPLQKAASLPTVAPIVRSARRPLRKTASDEPSPSAVEDPTTEETESTASSEDVAPSPPRQRPVLIFNPPPSITQTELTRITQRNTKKNQQSFNKLKVETLFLDYDRPPSPTSRIRRSMGEEGAPGRPSTKEGREARAAKRRNALRASVDGSEIEAFSTEIGESSPALTEHYRAPGDDEQYETPLRTGGGGALLSKKAAAAGKKKTSTGSVTASPAASGSTEVKETRRVKWDKALVYEGPKEDALPPVSDGIIKHTDLDDWGNSTTATSSFGKAAPVIIIKRVFKNDEDE